MRDALETLLSLRDQMLKEREAVPVSLEPEPLLARAAMRASISSFEQGIAAIRELRTMTGEWPS